MPPASPAMMNDVVAVGAVDGDGVGLRRRRRRSGRARSMLTSRDVGAGEVVDHDVVGAAERVEVDRARRR